MRVIPAIDLLNGQVVRLKKGDYKEVTTYNENPVDEAQKFKNDGFNHIHVVDLNGAKEGNFANLDIIQNIIKKTGLSVQSGGGIRSYEDGKKLLEAGVQQIICSSLAVKKPQEWQRLISEFKERVILGMDLKDGKVAYGGWLETSDQSIADFLEPMMTNGLSYVLSTDIARDGMLSGPNMELYKQLQHDFPTLNIIASGGVSDAGDLKKLNKLDLFGVVVGRAYYENKLTLDEMISYHSHK
ncbi:MAG: 1-(5-phosphoribosyl)-5-[(5-phosphoribosylamino)methylideneamino]imidazole-4-carboxamide isomerase [Balneolaceae bacterium]|nr:1-(5-phosphoribosyl)-5-[(5-phosphoribosylamino)methylideneamino]imidazole-4-carboxamide isomerase [Balneolaceae bacterium]